MHIGSKPGERVYRAKTGGDTFIVLDTVRENVRMYVTVDTLLQPSVEALAQAKSQPYYTIESIGMVYLLREVSCQSYVEAGGEIAAHDIVAALEADVGTI